MGLSLQELSDQILLMSFTKERWRGRMWVILCSLSLYRIKDLKQTKQTKTATNKHEGPKSLALGNSSSRHKAENSAVFVPPSSGLCLGLCPGGGLLPTCFLLFLCPEWISLHPPCPATPSTCLAPCVPRLEYCGNWTAWLSSWRAGAGRSEEGWLSASWKRFLVSQPLGVFGFALFSLSLQNECNNFQSV